MRIEPIEAPKGLLMRLSYWLLRRQLGKTITPWKVIFARLPRAIPSQLGIYWGLERGVGLDRDLALMLQALVAGTNGCAFCLDIGRAQAARRSDLLKKLDAVASFRTSSLFSDRERAALAYVEEATRTKRVTDDTFATMRRDLDEREVVGITWVTDGKNT